MIYYIPIHIENIDNVISAEGISPAEDYVVRGYGYSRYKVLKGIPSDKVVCLYSHIPYVDDDTVGKDQICYVEIDDKCVKKETDVVSFDGGVAVVGTVDLLPWNCRFLFPTEETLYQAVMVCRSSLCNKMWGFYRFSLLESKPEPSKKTVVPEICNSIKDIKSEVKKNRLKGFLFLYTLGRYISIPQTLANLLQIEKRMYDVATTIAGLQSYEKEGFLRQLNDLEVQFEKYDPVRIEVQKQWTAMIERSFAGKDNQLAFESIVRELGAEDLMKSNFAKKSGYNIRPRLQMSFARNFDWEYYKKSIDDYTQKQIQSYRMKNGDTNTTGDFGLEGTRVFMNPKYGYFYSKLITNIIEGLDWFNIENLRLHRLDFASELTRMARDQMIESGKTWEGSTVRAFLNDLRQHIAYGGLFDITKAPDITLKSLAVFILKGDDYEEMFRYMENNAQIDYRFVLGLLGVCVGYADLPKTLIQRMKLDSQGLSRIYLSAIHYLAEIPDGFILTLQPYEFNNTPKPNETFDGINKVLTDKSIGLTKAQKEALMKIWKESNGKVGKVFFEHLAEVKGIGKVKLGKIKEQLEPKSLPSGEEQLELFERKPEGTLIQIDLTAWRYIEPLLPDDRIIRTKVKEDFKWFLSRKRRTETNQSLISHYKEHLLQKAYPKNPRYSWMAEYFGHLDIDGIIEQLEKNYL